MKLGTLRYIFVRTIDTLEAGGEDSVKAIVIEGDKFSFAIDGMIIFANTITNPHKLTIDFSLFTEVGEEKLLQNFPYSIRGTRYNPNYIPLKKDTTYPILPLRKEIYVKLTNNDSANAVEGIAYAVLGYPILKEVE